MKRIFIAIELSIDLSHRLVRFQESFDAEIQDENFSIKLTRPEDIHSTLVFIGDTPVELIPIIVERLKTLATSLFPFEVIASGVDAFPSASAAKILWAGFDKKSAELLELIKRAIEKELLEIGVEKEVKPFVPHVTLGRMKSMKPVDLSAIKEFDPAFGSTLVREIILFESLSNAGSYSYSVLDRFPLGQIKA